MDRSERKIKQTVSHNAETADRDRVKKETSDYTRKYATPLGPILFHIRESLEVEIISIEERTFQESFPRKKAQRYPETSTYRTWIKKEPIYG